MLELNWKLVRRFYNAMMQHLDGARFLVDGCIPFSASLRAAESIYLGGYAVECGLKAMLFSRIRERRHQDLLREVIEQIGHDLEKLQARLARLPEPFVLDGGELRAFHVVRRAWNSQDRYAGLAKPVETAREFVLAVETITRHLI